MKRIIFLDVDGVLNSINKLIEVYKLTGKSHSCYDYPFDDNCLEYLKYIVEETEKSSLKRHLTNFSFYCY